MVVLLLAFRGFRIEVGDDVGAVVGIASGIAFVADGPVPR